MIKEDYFIRYAKLVLRNPKGIVDKKAANILKMNLPQLNNIIFYFISEALVIRFRDESAKSSEEIPKWEPLIIGWGVRDNVSKPTLKMAGWLRREEEKLREKNVNRFTLLLALFLGFFNLGLSFIPDISVRGINISWIISLLISLFIGGIVYKKI